MRNTALFLAALLLATAVQADHPPRLLRVKDVTHFSDIQNREPMLAELADGTLLVTGFPKYPHEPPRAPSLWRSTNGGEQWQRVDVGSPADGAIGNSDVDLVVAPDGTVYFVTMGYNRSTGEGTHIAIGVSKDEGETWEWQQLAGNPRVDRPWVTVATDGSVHVIWNDGTGVFHTSSRDQGSHFDTATRVTDKGGSSHFAAGPNGRLAIRITPISASGLLLDRDYDFLMVSLDGGERWQRRELPGKRHWEWIQHATMPRWVEPIAWTGDGSLFYLWSEGQQMYLARSANDGASWNQQEFARDESMCFFPWLGADRAGEGLVASWFAASDGRSVRVATVDLLNDGGLSVAKSPPLRFESWMEVQGEWMRDTAGEYVPVARLLDGDLALVTPLQDPRDDRMGFSFWRLGGTRDGRISPSTAEGKAVNDPP